MNSVWSKGWKKCLIWFSSYMSFVAFALVGGYVIVKNEDEELKKTAKTALIVTLIFTAISAVLSVFYNFGSLSNTFFSSTAYDFYDIISKFLNVAKIVVYAIFVIMSIVKKDDENQNPPTDENAE